MKQRKTFDQVQDDVADLRSNRFTLYKSCNYSYSGDLNRIIYDDISDLMTREVNDFQGYAVRVRGIDYDNRDLDDYYLMPREYFGTDSDPLFTSDFKNGFEIWRLDGDGESHLSVLAIGDLNKYTGNRRNSNGFPFVFNHLTLVEYSAVKDISQYENLMDAYRFGPSPLYREVFDDSLHDMSSANMDLLMDISGSLDSRRRHLDRNISQMWNYLNTPGKENILRSNDSHSFYYLISKDRMITVSVNQLHDRSSSHRSHTEFDVEDVRTIKGYDDFRDVIMTCSMNTGYDYSDRMSVIRTDTNMSGTGKDVYWIDEYDNDGRKAMSYPKVISEDRYVINDDYDLLGRSDIDVSYLRSQMVAMYMREEDMSSLHARTDIQDVSDPILRHVIMDRYDMNFTDMTYDIRSLNNICHEDMGRDMTMDDFSSLYMTCSRLIDDGHIDMKDPDDIDMSNLGSCVNVMEVRADIVDMYNFLNADMPERDDIGRNDMSGMEDKEIDI